MPLQMASGKLFRSDPSRTNELRGILYTNLELLAPLETNAGRLVPTHNLWAPALVYELKEHMEHPMGVGVLVSRGIAPYLSDFAAVTAFGLHVVCTPDQDLKRRLLVGPPSPTTGAMPRKFASSSFSERVICQPLQAQQFADFVGQLMGLRRAVFLDAMRAIRTYVTGMYRLSDDLDAAYALLLSSPEPLLPHFVLEERTWDDYPENRRRPIDRALRNADEQTQEGVRGTLLGLDKNAVARRFRRFVDAHLDASFFRGEAAGAASPVGRSELPRCLGHAYALRSSYLHGSKRLPRELTLWPSSGAETIRVGRETVLTFEGLGRLTRHVIMQFILRQKSIANDPCDYSGEEPGIIRAELAPEYWLPRPGDFTAGDGQKRLFAFCGQLAAAMRTNKPPTITDMRDMLRQAHSRLPGMIPKDRLPFIALYCLFNLVVPADDRIDDNSDIARLYEKELALPTVEAMLLALLTEGTLPSPLEEHEKALRAYFEGTGRDQGIKLDRLLEAGLTLELAERYRVGGDTHKARSLISFALENHPGNHSLMRFEREFDLSKQIKWQEVMELPSD